MRQTGTRVAIAFDMRRFAIGCFLLMHGLAHAAIGMAAQDMARRAPFYPELRVALATLLFAVAAPGFVAAGLGSWGVVGLARFRSTVVRAAAAASALLLLGFMRRFSESAIGLGLDVLALAIAGSQIELVASASAGRSAS